MLRIDPSTHSSLPIALNFVVGSTVYELLNDITKWTTHDTMVNNQAMKNRLNEKASTWFMKGQWHNRNVAPSVEVRRAPRFSDSIALL